MGHPGLTNAYQVNSGSDLSLVYNDQSVLENHHSHVAALLLKQPDTAILAELRTEERNKLRKSMISIILHTDMSYHQDIVTQLLQFNNRRCDESAQASMDSSDRCSESSLSEMDKQFLCETVVHLGDLSNPVMRWDQNHEWSLRVIDEFIAQSSLENEHNLKATMEYVKDKSPESISKVQTSFIDYVVKPLWRNASNIAPELESRLAMLEENRNNWENYAKHYQELNVRNANDINKIIEE